MGSCARLTPNPRETTLSSYQQAGSSLSTSAIVLTGRDIRREGVNQLVPPDCSRLLSLVVGGGKFLAGGMPFDLLPEASTINNDGTVVSDGSS